MKVSTIVVCAAVFGVAASAQAPQPQPQQMRHEVTVVERGGGVPGGAGIFMAAENSAFAKVVKGAPFSADSYSEFRQVLGDGNVIERKTRGASYRDSEGRTRTENTIGGGVIGATEPHSVIMIRDTVANVQWVLDPDNKIATKLEIQAPPIGIREAGPNPDTLFEMPAPAPMPHASGMAVGPMVQSYRLRSDQAKEEKLGTQNVNGVQAEGTRVTMTVPAGEIGNVQPIVVVTERWYSPQLQMVVRTKHSDPRMGEQTFEMTNIRLGEPPASQFQVPAGYQVKEGKLRMQIRHAPGADGAKDVEVRKQIEIRHAPDRE